MALELVGGAVLGVVFDQLRKEIWRVKDNVVTFKPKLERLEETLEVLCPVIQEIEELNRQLNRPDYRRETIILGRLLEEGTKLVCRCSKIPRWDFLKRSRYREKLMELDNKILRFHNIYMQAHMGRDQKQTLLFVQETREMMIMSLNQLGFSNPTLGLTASSSTDSSYQVMKKNEVESLPVLMPGDEAPKFIAMARPCNPPKHENIAIQVHRDDPPVAIGREDLGFS